MTLLEVEPIELGAMDVIKRRTDVLGVDRITILDADEYADVGEQLKYIKALEKEAKAALDSITAPLRTAELNARDLFRPVLGRLSTAESNCKAALLEWDEAQARIQRERERLAREDAAKERDRLEKLAAQNAAKGNEARAEEYERQARNVPAPIIPRSAPTPRVSGLATVEVWGYEIVDEALIPREYFTLDTAKLGGVVRRLKGDTNIAGVRAVMRLDMRAGSR